MAAHFRAINPWQCLGEYQLSEFERVSHYIKAVSRWYSVFPICPIVVHDNILMAQNAVCRGSALSHCHKVHRYVAGTDVVEIYQPQHILKIGCNLE